MRAHRSPVSVPAACRQWCAGGGELLPGGDGELWQALGEVPFGGPGGDEPSLGDVAVGQAGGGELGDAAFAGRQRAGPAEDEPPGSSARDDEFGAGPRREAANNNNG